MLLYFRLTSPALKNPAWDNLSTAQENAGGDLPAVPGIHWRAWAPFIAILAAIPVAFFVLRLSHGSSINFIMLAGVVTALALSPREARASGLSQGAKHAGLIIFDICGAGALGFVIVSSGFAQEAVGEMSLLIPVILVPFLLSALIETAQGSRVVTAVITAEVLAGFFGCGFHSSGPAHPSHLRRIVHRVIRHRSLLLARAADNR